ncbi:glutamate racemase [Nitratireductor indicus]|uniref:glutamate racemase n=1 Tax=Nitratireductor indicus TaxID=721133 RepID=UPI0028768E06|nr:aspartate/glutamate racemase family protein [Nitratireductor indicus]MDS1136483.1 aspartate/glutamate racemase family protein [Nitratireductor indicus]
MTSLHRPIAVFDAGIGSYAIVAEIRKRLPRQDILYFADRASFPYGAMGRERMLATMRATIDFLSGYDPCAIVIASNAPSIMVFDAVKPFSPVPIFGVFPPLAEALEASQSGWVGIMGVRSLIESEMLPPFIARHTDNPQRVATFNASSMVALVEDGSFLFDPVTTQEAVNAFTGDIFARYPDIDVLTLSSTHLPWLRPFFEKARPSCMFLDPAEAIVAGIGDGKPGNGHILGLVTESPDYDLATFQRMLALIGVDIPLESVAPLA